MNEYVLIKRYQSLIITIAIITMTMYRAEHYDYSLGVWSLLMLTAWVVPFVHARWPALVVSTVVYGLFHVSMYGYFGLGDTSLFIKHVLVGWCVLVVIDVIRSDYSK